MKIKKFLIPGFIFTIIGLIGLLVILAYNRFDIKKIASENVEVEESLYDTNVNLIKCNTKADSIVIKASERSDIYVKSKKINNYKYSITKDDVILNIDCQYGRWYENVLNIGWMNELGFANEALFIEVPNDYVFALEVDVKGGNLKLQNVNLSNVSINIKGGSFTASNIEASELLLNVKGGTANISNSLINKGTFNYDATTSNLENLELEKLDIDMDVTTLDASIKITKEANLKYTTSNINIKLIDGKDNYNFNASGKEKAFNYEGTTSNIEIN